MSRFATMTVLLTWILALPPAPAQNAPNMKPSDLVPAGVVVRNQDIPLRRTDNKARAESLFSHLKTPPKDLPGIPVIANGNTKFIVGLSKSDKGVNSLFLNYMSKERPDQVYASFARELSTDGWKVESNGVPRSMQATMNGNRCTITVMDSQSPGYPSNYTISYIMKASN